MTQCNSQLSFGSLGGKEIIGGFEGGDISSDGGLMLVAEADQRLGLTRRLSESLVDRRQPAKVRHQISEMLAQRVYQIALGYEDCNDADDLRCDPIFKTAVGRLPESGRDLASQPTLSRLENAVSRTQLYRMSEVFVAQFMAKYRRRRPWRMVLDFDATDDPSHGQQQFAGFHGFYHQHCYLPLIVTAQVDDGPEELLVAMLRPGRSHAGREALAVLKRLVARLRETWPGVRILFRGDSGFALPEIYDWCEEHGVDYLIGLITNPRLRALAEPYLQQARAEHERSGDKVRRIHHELYAAESWPHERRVLIKAEVADKGDNARFVVTNLTGDPERLYDRYAARGESENRIKELKCDLQIDRTSCHRFVANQFRVLLHAAAFVLLSFVREQLRGTKWAVAQVGTLQRRLLKLGVLVKETARRVWLSFASGCPLQWLWPLLLARLRAAPV